MGGSKDHQSTRVVWGQTPGGLQGRTRLFVELIVFKGTQIVRCWGCALNDKPGDGGHQVGPSACISHCFLKQWEENNSETGEQLENNGLWKGHSKTPGFQVCAHPKGPL